MSKSSNRPKCLLVYSGTNYNLKNLLETWNNILDIGKIIDAILIDLSKMFGCMYHNLHVVKFSGDIYNFSEDTSAPLHSHLKPCKEKRRQK